jgi:hypothetical protein
MAKKKASARNSKEVAAVTLKLSLNDLKKITESGSSFGGDSWQQIHWGKIDVGLEPVQQRATVAAKKATKKTSKKG